MNNKEKAASELNEANLDLRAALVKAWENNTPVPDYVACAITKYLNLQTKFLAEVNKDDKKDKKKA